MTIVSLEIQSAAPSRPWFIRFLKDELRPYPGRWNTVIRMVLTATLTMLVVMTLRSPNSAIGIFFGLTISRENPASTIKNGIQTILAFLAGFIYTLVGVTIFVNDQLPHFIFIAFSLALMFFVIRTLKSYSSAFGFCFVVVTALPVWDLPFPIDAHVDNNIWAVFGVILGVCIAFAVEYILSPQQKVTDEIQKGLNHRLTALQTLLQAYPDGKDIPSSKEMEDIKQLARLGTGRLKGFLTRSSFDDESGFQKGQWVGIISVVERLVDTASNLGAPRKVLSSQDISRLQALQSSCETLKKAIIDEELPSSETWNFSQKSSRALPLLPELEQKFEQLPHTYERIDVYHKPISLKALHWQQLFIADAFTNVEYLHFAAKGTLTGLACYVFYSAVDWHGLETSLATCVITALSTMGSSRQKQILRIGGAIFGGLILGMGSQIFILPYLDTIWGFTVLFTIVTGISVWITTSSSRLSYFGLQMALAFYLIMFQSAAIETSLDIARDRVIGTLLGLLAMWWIFDQLWTKPAIREMRDAFAANMRYLGELTNTMLSESPSLSRMNALRENINNSFIKMDENADMVLFETGRQRAQHLYWRTRIKGWQNAQEDLFLAQLAINHYRSQMRINECPESLRETLFMFNEGLTRTWLAIATTIAQDHKPFVQEHSLSPLIERLRKEAFLHFGPSPDDAAFHRIEAILDLDEQMVAITESLKQEVLEEDSWRLAA